MIRRPFMRYAMASTLALAITLALLQWVVVQARSETETEATTEQVREFLNVYRGYERLTFDALVSGNTTRFPEVFYNDPTVDIVPEHAALAEQFQTQVDAVLARVESGPAGAETGFLSASIAEMIAVTEQATAWEAAKAAASASGREPTVADLPEGFQPVERKRPEEWVDVDVHIHNVRIQGEHGWATFTFGTDRLEGNLLHMTFTNVNGQWYISSARGEGDA